MTVPYMDFVAAVTMQNETTLDDRKAQFKQKFKSSQGDSFKENLVENLHVLYDFFTDKQRDQ